MPCSPDQFLAGNATDTAVDGVFFGTEILEHMHCGTQNRLSNSSVCWLRSCICNPIKLHTADVLSTFAAHIGAPAAGAIDT